MTDAMLVPVLIYLLVGFVFYFVSIETGQLGAVSWQWNLAAVLLWPVSVIVGCFS